MSPLAVNLSDRAPGLPEPADYFPLERGRYEVQAGLKILGQQPVQGIVEHHHFTQDGLLPQYLRNKQANMQLAPERYHPPHEMAAALGAEVLSWWLGKLNEDFPSRFAHERASTGALRLKDSWTGWQLTFDEADNVVAASCSAEPRQGFEGLDLGMLAGRSGLDALACLVAEDVAIVRREPPDGRDRLVWIHLNCPNHWSAAEKMGKDFLAVHQPVADFGNIAKAADRILDAMIHRGPFIRFAWGVATDTVLDHHPESPAGRALGNVTPEGALAGTWLRIERQTLRGFPSHDAALFTIRTYFLPVARVATDPDRRDLLRDAILSISPDALRYKGIAPYRNLLLSALS